MKILDSNLTRNHKIVVEHMITNEKQDYSRKMHKHESKLSSNHIS